ncbi:hypothetical protein [Dokdonella soli]|uniref:Uncharacterized protein n=1 Tax=Dokdonella soli TaxID=529810 RepID=A0ABN1ILD9_9GAMM
MNRFVRNMCLATCVAAAAPLSIAASRIDADNGSAPSADLPSVAAQPWNAQPRAVLDGASPTVADVGDVNSFGRNLHWLGLALANVAVAGDCTGTDPSIPCQTLAPAPATTSFSFTDVAHIALPEKASNSLLCYWFSPVLSYAFNNPTAAPVVARLRYNPTLTVENPLLATPGLIDPTTGMPFSGKLETSMTSSQLFELPLPAGMSVIERKRDSSVCMAGLLSRQALVETYGLTAAQAKEFFKRPTTVRLNINGSAQYVDQAAMTFGLRIIGD